MMRMTWATSVAILFLSTHATAQQAATAPSYAQQQVQQQQAQQQPVQPQQAQDEAQKAPAARVANQGQRQPAAQQQPFPPLSAAAKAQLQKVLLQWEQQSKGTKTLDCKFTRWHFDNIAAPPGIHASRADGVVKYHDPDKGLFRVDHLVFYSGMQDGKPGFKAQPGQFGEHWVCNGHQLIEFDRTKKECRIQDLPLAMQGKNIISSPLPFVFNLDAQQIQQRYWVRLMNAGKPGILLIEAWPKRQEDRAQYKLVQIALDADKFVPQALIMYAPNFNPKTAPRWDHYEFSDVKRNAIGAQLQIFLKNFIAEKPPATWKILREKFIPPAEPAAQRAAAPGANQNAR